MNNLLGKQSAGHSTALLMIDVINDMEFVGGDRLLEFAEPIVQPLVELKRRARRHHVPVIYVNDNFGMWRSDFAATFENVCNRPCRGQAIADALRPDDEDFFVLKPKHSGFHYTPLPLLLTSLGVRRLVLCGVAGNICVLFTANDAIMHGYEVVIPRDTLASESREANDWALRQFRDVFDVQTPRSKEVRFDAGPADTAAAVNDAA